MDLGQIFNNIPHPPGCNCNACTCNNFYAPPPPQNNCNTGSIDFCTLLILFFLFSSCNSNCNNGTQTAIATCETSRRRRKRDKDRYVVVEQPIVTSTPYNATNSGFDSTLLWLLLLFQGGLGGSHNDPSSANNTNTIINVLSDEDFKRKTDNTNNNS